MHAADASRGQIAVVGLPAGDPRGLTILGGRLLGAATAVVFAADSNLSVLAMTAPQAQWLSFDGPVDFLPEDLAHRMAALAGAGEQVVWLAPPDLVPRLQAQPPASWTAAAVSVVWAPGVSDESAPPCGGGTLDRPLAGQTVLVTRPRHQAAALWEPLVACGAEVLIQPAIEIRPPVDWEPLDAALARLASFDWVVFSSSNGVAAVVDRLWQTGGDLRRLAAVRLAAIGPGTAEELAAAHLRADLVPEEFRAEALAAALKRHGGGGRFLLIRASRGREVLAEELRAAGGEVEQVVAYHSIDVAAAEPFIRDRMAHGRIAWTTVTSSAIARSLVRLFGDELRRTRLASISPITSGTLRELGHAPAAEAAVYTMDGVVAAVVAAEQGGRSQM